jgi:hypothetical protein
VAGRCAHAQRAVFPEGRQDYRRVNRTPSVLTVPLSRTSSRSEQAWSADACHDCRMSLGSRAKSTWRLLGPGFVTGSSDDDPSGVDDEAGEITRCLDLGVNRAGKFTEVAFVQCGLEINQQGGMGRYPGCIRSWSAPENRCGRRPKRSSDRTGNAAQRFTRHCRYSHRVTVTGHLFLHGAYDGRATITGTRAD